MATQFIDRACTTLTIYTPSALAALFNILSLYDASLPYSTCNGINMTNRPGRRCGNPLNPIKRRAIGNRLDQMVHQHPRDWLDMPNLRALAEDALCKRNHGKVGGQHSQIDAVAVRYWRRIEAYLSDIERYQVDFETWSIEDRQRRVMEWLMGMIDEEERVNGGSVEEGEAAAQCEEVHNKAQVRVGSNRNFTSLAIPGVFPSSSPAHAQRRFGARALPMPPSEEPSRSVAAQGSICPMVQGAISSRSRAAENGQTHRCSVAIMRGTTDVAIDGRLGALALVLFVVLPFCAVACW